MKIKKIEVKNFKAIDNQIASFNGCSAIVTAGNDKGKTSLLRGLIDRFRSEIPEIIVKQGEKKGYNKLELTDGSRIEWEFTEKSESFAYITKEGIKQTTGVLKMIGEKYFGVKFDIDKFLNSSPKEQMKELQKIVGIDFTEIDNEYKLAYEERKEANLELKNLRAQNLKSPEKVDKPDIDSLKKELEGIKLYNDNLRSKWKDDNEKHLKEIQEFNDKQTEKSNRILDHTRELNSLNLKLLSQFFDYKLASEYIAGFPKPEPKKVLKNLDEPEYQLTAEIESKIETANNQLRLYDNYERDLQAYENWLNEGKKAKEKVELCENKVKEIESRKKQMINNANIPAEFQFTDDGILYKNLPLSSTQISSSSKYIAALKLGLMVIGEVRTMHFDASFLDKNSLSEIMKWSNDNDLQLLIERPDFEAGEIKFEIIENI